MIELVDSHDRRATRNKDNILAFYERSRARVVVHRIIAVGDYVCAHVNFLNLFNDDPEDPGVAGVDIYRMDANGRAVEHWDTLPIAGDSKNAAPWLALTALAPILTVCSNSEAAVTGKDTWSCA